MEVPSKRKQVCQVCQKEKALFELIPANLISDALVKIIKEENPDWVSDGYICYDDFSQFRTRHIRELLTDERGELSGLEVEVARSVEEQELLTQNINKEFDTALSFGERLSDKIASFGGSWKFIIIFMLIILGWIVINAMQLLSKPFDPYPFILLNLVLSCLAALQAPVIMMSQNRQESKDRLRAEHDFKINLKAELEVRQMNEKIDHLMHRQMVNLMEIQQMQMEMLSDIIARMDTENKKKG